MRLVRVSLLVAFALAVAGCGAKNQQSGSVPAGAEFAPASAAVYISGVTDPASSQWAKAEKLLGRFPGREKLLASARQDLKKDGLTWERDVKPALGAELSLVVLDFDNLNHNYVFFTKPKDEAKFDKLLESGDDPQVHRKIDGWTVFADNDQSINNFEQARGGDSLSGKSTFRDAMKSVSDDATLRGYVSGESLYAAFNKEVETDPDAQALKRFSQSFGTLESVSFSTAAEDDGVAVEATYKSKDQAKVGSFSPELDQSLPANALLYVSFGNLEDAFNSAIASADKSFPEFKQQRSQIESALGFSLKDDLFPLFSKEGAIAVYRNLDELQYPIVLFTLRVPDEAEARRVVDRFAALASLGGGATVQPFTVHGAEGKEIVFSFPAFSVFAVVTDGKALVSNSKAQLELALGSSKKLADDAVYRDARDAAGAPDKTTGFVYLNLEAGLPYIFDFVEMGEPGTITPEVSANTKPLQSALLYSTRDGDRTTLSGFLTIK